MEILGRMPTFQARGKETKEKTMRNERDLEKETQGPGETRKEATAPAQHKERGEKRNTWQHFTMKFCPQDRAGADTILP